MKYHFVAIAVLALLLFAAQSFELRSSVTTQKAVHYDVSRTPTANQLIAACNSEWLSLTKNGYYDLTGFYFVDEIMKSSTDSLLSAAYVDEVFNKRVCQRLGWCDSTARRSAARVFAQCFVDQTLAGRAGCFRTPSMTVRDWIDGNTMGRQDPPCRSASAPATRPKVAVKPAPKTAAPVTKPPPARPDQTVSRRSEADAKYAAELREYERKLAAQQKAVADYNAAQRQMAADKAAAAARASAAQEEFARQRAAYQAEQDRYASERAEYEATIGNPGTPWKQQGKDARIIASDGKSAVDCVKLIELTKTDSGMGGGGRVLSNQCSGPVEITWCYSPGDCDTETGSGWTVQAGKSWPVSAEKNIRWAACHGANTAAFVKGSHGLRYYCKAPEEK